VAVRPKRTKWTNALRLACWDTGGVRGRKQKLDHFLEQHGIDICLLAETHLRSGEVFRLANYVCHRNDRLNEKGETAILVRRGIVHNTVPVQGLQHLEATAIQVMLAAKSVKILTASLSPTRPLIVSDLYACLGGGLPVLMAGDLNAKHVKWNSRLITKRSRSLCDFADKNSCLIHGPNTPTTVPHNPSASPDVLYIVITRDLVFPVHQITCSAMSSDHLPVLIDTKCRSSFLSPPDRPDLKKTDWLKFHACLEAGMPPSPDLPNEGAIHACVKELTGAGRFHSQVSPKCRPTTPATGLYSA
jgi:hypothetical protein